MKSDRWEVDHNSPFPYYYQLEQQLVREIERGRWKKGDQMPSEGEISKLYRVSLGVVRQAFRRLEKKGLILRKKGKKAVVNSDRKIHLEFMDNQISQYAELKSKGFQVHTKVLENTLIYPTDEIASFLKIDTRQHVVKLSRLRFVESKPMLFWTSYLPADLFPGLENMDLSDKSLYETLSEEYGVQPASAERSFSVTVGEPHVYKLLDILLGEPTIYIQWISYTKDSRGMEYYEGWHTVNNWKFTFHSKIEH